MDESYDALAPDYDSHFHRPVDHWEDERLARIFRPAVDGKNVLDLGCGTGWLLDHCNPQAYVGVDASAAMLGELTRKHEELYRGQPYLYRGQSVYAIKAVVGADGWMADLPGGHYDAITATWALQYLFDGTAAGLQRLLGECCGLIDRGGAVMLHGYLPRYRHRHHYIGWPTHVPPVVRPELARSATRGTGLHGPAVIGCGALPDWAAKREGWWWSALNLVPDAWHYSAVWVWSRP